MIEPITFWTAAGVIVIVIGGLIGFVLKTLHYKINDINQQVQEKAHKDDITRIEARMDRENRSVAAALADLKQDIKDMEARLISFFSAKK